MSWIRDIDGDLINLDFAEAILLLPEADSDNFVIAADLGNTDSEGQPLYKFLFVSDEESCRRFMATLAIKLPTIKVS